MRTVAENAAEAERLVHLALTYWEEGSRELADLTIQQAQVCATLATVPDSSRDLLDAARRQVIEQITHPAALDAFRRAWHRADADGHDGSRVLAGLAAAVAETRL